MKDARKQARTDEQMKAQLKLDPINDLIPRLEKRGIQPIKSLREKWLKLKVALAEGLAAAKAKSRTENALQVRESLRSFTRSGLRDKTSSEDTMEERVEGLKENGRKLKKELNPVLSDKEGLLFPIDASHFINRIRLNRWSQRLQRIYKLADNS